jgi:glycosyltransferase involved in cell wall biosynthesis
LEKTKKKIAYLFNQPFFMGGGEISLFELIRTIDRDRFEPVAVVPDEGEVKERLKPLGCKILVNPFPALKRLLTGQPLRQIRRLFSLLKKDDVDLIHANGSRVGFYGGAAGRIMRVPVVWHIREALPDYYLYDGLLGSMATAIICVSNSARIKRFGRYNRYISQKISVVYNGVDTKRLKKNDNIRDRVRRQYGFGQNDIVFGLVGNIIPRKSQDFFIKGIAMARDTNPSVALKAIVIGRCLDAGYKNKLQRLVADLKLQNDIIFRDYSPEIIDVFSTLDVFVLSSKSEGFSRALLEAMSCGLPVIASKIGEIEEAVIDRKHGILVELNNVNKMARAIIEFSKDKKLRRDIGQRNRRDAEQQFSLAKHTQKIESIYAGLLEGSIN